MVQPLKFGNGLLILSHILQGMLGLKLTHGSKEAPGHERNLSCLY